MSEKTLPGRSDSRAIEQFIHQIRRLPGSGASAGRVIFALDATASREPTWDRASDLQSELFLATAGLGGLSIQLCYYRGYRQFQATRFVSRTDQLLQLMNGVSCQGGITQIDRLLQHALEETRKQPLKAVVFIGDCCEEPVDPLCHLAGELGMLRTPVFMFQEGTDAHAQLVFEQISRLSGGAYAPFDHSSPQLLRELLGAVAVYAAGGHKALTDRTRQGSDAVRRLTRQLR